MKESEITLTLTELKSLIKRIPVQCLVVDHSTFNRLAHESTSVIGLSDLYEKIEKLKERKIKNHGR